VRRRPVVYVFCRLLHATFIHELVFKTGTRLEYSETKPAKLSAFRDVFSEKTIDYDVKETKNRYESLFERFECRGNDGRVKIEFRSYTLDVYLKLSRKFPNDSPRAVFVNRAVGLTVAITANDIIACAARSNENST